MKIKNISAKVIGVLGKDLLPDAEYDFSEAVVSNESVQALINMGCLQVDDSAEKAKALEDEVRAKIMKEMEEAEEKPKARRTRKSQDSVEEETAQ